ATISGGSRVACHQAVAAERADVGPADKLPKRHTRPSRSLLPIRHNTHRHRPQRIPMTRRSARQHSYPFARFRLSWRDHLILTQAASRSPIMRTNPILQKLEAGQCVGCHWLALGSPSVAEIMAQGRPDGVVFDLQHGLWTRETLEHGIGLIRHLTTVLCRVAANTPHAIGSALDAGARGVIVPFVETAEEAEAAVVAAKYPPRGQRSFGNVRPVF